MPRRKKKDSEDESDYSAGEEEESDDEDNNGDEQEVGQYDDSARKRGPSARRTNRSEVEEVLEEEEEQVVSSPSRRRRARHEESKERDDDDDSSAARSSNSDEDFAVASSSSSSEEEEYTPSRRHSSERVSSKKQPARSRKSAAKRKRPMSAAQRRSAIQKTPPGRASRSRRSVDDEESEEEEAVFDQVQVANGGKRTSPRKSPRKTYQEQDDQEGGSSDDEKPKAKQRRRAADDEEEEFDPEKNASSSSSSEEEAFEQEENEILPEDMEVMEEEEEGEEKISNQKPLFSQDDSDEEDDDDDDDDDSSSPNKRILACTSTQDAITDEELPMRHVCFFPPDQSSRQCFALETLRKIALAAGHPKFRCSISGDDQQTFLQPPHFRSAMSDDLLDQIASRFGREALDLHGSYYNRRMADEDAIDSVREQEDIDDSFLEQIHDYVAVSMRNQDLYCCPICYTVAYRRLKGRTADKTDLTEGQLAELYPTEYAVDPMRILISLGQGNFYIPAMFCFRKLSEVKRHLREEHHVDTKVVDGNDLYTKYKIRAPDGLLQRFLNSNQRIYRKSMQSYWHHDMNSYDFCYLVNLVRQAGVYYQRNNSSAATSDNSEPPVPDFVAPAQEYFQSVALLNDRLWDLLVAPFRKYDEVQDDFLAHDDDDVDEGAAEGGMHPGAFRVDDSRESAAEAEEMAARIRQRYQEQEEDEMMGEDEMMIEIKQGNDLEDTSEEEDGNGVAEESHANQSDEDEWERNQAKRRGSIGRRRPKPPRRRRFVQELTDSGRKKRVIADSSDEDE